VRENNEGCEGQTIKTGEGNQGEVRRGRRTELKSDTISIENKSCDAGDQKAVHRDCARGKVGNKIEQTVEDSLQAHGKAEASMTNLW